MPRLLMLDSGAYSVWTKGASVDIKEYAKFCLAHPKVSYYVSLDVITGKPGSSDPVSSLDIEECCKRGWENYQYLISFLPEKKVIPVFHLKDPIKWLHRYMTAGATYVGLGGLALSSSAERLSFLRNIRPVLFDGSGKPRLRLHGFGMTSMDVMNYWEWHSVDSTAWKHCASWGAVYVPRRTQGTVDYGKEPMVIAFSDASPKQSRKQEHYRSLSPYVKEQVDDYLLQEGIVIGDADEVTVSKDYKITRGSDETWLKRGAKVLRPKLKGVSNSFEMRAEANIAYVKKMARCVDVENLYFAGAPMPYPCDLEASPRLLSYYDVGRMTRTGYGCLERHLKTMGKK
jgi:uncharacterized Zn ribbon protein